MLRLKFFIFNFLLFFTLCCHASIEKLYSLSLEDAISLAVRENPNVKQARLNHLSEKYSLELARWQFKPHYSFTATRMTQSNYEITNNGYVTQSTTGVNGVMSWLSPIGTKATISPNLNRTNHFQPGLTFEISQPLIKGFGKAIVEASLRNALDSEKISCLNVEGSLRSTVTRVVNAYLDVIASEKILELDRQSLKRSEISVNQTKMFIRSGRKASVELVAVKADVENAKLRIENDKNNLDQARFSLLSVIGINPNSKVKFITKDISSLIEKYKIPSLLDTKKLILENDIQYQSDQITFEGSRRRSIIEAKDQMRWELNLRGSVYAGNNSSVNGSNNEINSFINNLNQTNQVAVDLKIPINDLQLKTSLANAKIGLKQAAIALQQERWTKETMAINLWNGINSSKRSLVFARNAQILQKKSYDISIKKYSHGLIDSLQLQSSQQQLFLSSQALNSAKINYLKALVIMDEVIGGTLKTWCVDVYHKGKYKI
ncbi:TolC family protein [Gammaproteobacteria bacterium]|nr:TolC family protein [Gammaproteobacteria bacterium]